MPVIDAHQHFWQYHPVKHSWINDDMSVIRKDFYPAELQPILQQQQIDGCIAVQADQTEAETDWLISLADKVAFIKGVVGWVDLRADTIRERLAHYHQFPIVKGFRHILQGEDPSFMLQPDFLRGIKALQEFGFSYDVLIYPKHLPAALALVKQFPEQLFVIDHLAKPDIKNGEITDWKKGMEAMALCPNVFCKVSGMVTEADWHHWQPTDLFPYLDIVTDAFGMQRLLYGSDWPVCLVAASYERMMAPVKEYYSNFSAAEQAALFGQNAAAFYHV
jgi:L-fuconolactonase